MSVDKLVDSTQLDSDLASVANAIRARGGTSTDIAFPAGFVSAVGAIGNQYSAGDEGKVVSSGELVAQTAHAEVTQNGTIDTTLNNSVTVNVAEKWNYVWEASFEALPWGMTANNYDFITESGAMFVDRPAIDFSHIGDCEIEIECKWGTNNTTTSPQIIVKYGERDGFKVYPAAGTNKLNSNVSGSVVVYVDDITQYHVYNLKISGNNCTLTIDGTPYTGHGVTDNEYLGYTGITKINTAADNRYMYIKSLKYSGGSYAELLTQLTNTRMIAETLVGGAE